MNAAKVLDDLKRRFPNEPEYHQAVEEVISSRTSPFPRSPLKSVWVTVRAIRNTGSHWSSRAVCFTKWTAWKSRSPAKPSRLQLLSCP